MWQDDDNGPPSANELLRWEADAIGEGKPDVEWVLTDYDVWMRNPHYTGTRTKGHPEDHDDDDSCVGHRCEGARLEEIAGLQAMCDAEAKAAEDDTDWPDDLPF